jgi:multidrug efflux pump subunit AcrA (membrane-fusion protein)
VIVSINGEVGEFVGSSGGTTAQAPGVSAPLSLSSGSSSSAGSSGGSAGFMVISDTSQYYAVVPFAEADASNLQANQPASITFDAIPGLTISGHLVGVAPNATVSSSVVNYYASFVLNHGDPRLRTGLTANAAVTVAQADNVLYVPTSAIRQQNGASMVTVYMNGEQIPTEVETGIVGDSVTEIKGGLTEGQQVVLPTLRLSSGSGAGTGAGGLLGRGGFGGGGGFRGGG